MDYSVGSLADLITGSVTPHKPKVVKKHISSENEPAKMINSPDGENLVSIKKIRVRYLEHIETEPDKKPTKRKLTDEGVLKSKKSKNISENAEQRINKSNIKKEDPETLEKTVFVGNLPITINPKKFKKLFMKYGNIESVRIRGVSIADPKVPKKVAVIKKQFHPERKSFHGYVRFENQEDAIKATEMNGTIYNDHHLRVHYCGATDKPDESKAIFVGNLSFYAEEDDLWKLFESCGPVESVRIIRDGKTGIGKGFGYVNFKNSDSVALALEMEHVEVKGRELRINICNLNAARKNQKNNVKRQITKPGKPQGSKGDKKRVKTHDTTANENMKESVEETVEKNALQSNKMVENREFKNKSYQGAKFTHKKKKNKVDKSLLQKKAIIKKVAPK